MQIYLLLLQDIRPSVNHYRAVLFDADEAKPRFIWLLCKWLENDEEEEDEEENYQMPITKAIIGDDSASSHAPIQHNSRLDIPLSDTIFVTYRDTFLIDGSRPNKSVASITSTQPGTYTDWRGPIVAYAKVGRRIDPPTCRHFDMVDFRHVTDHFLSHGYTLPKAQVNVARVKGVRINCLGDVKMLKKPHFEAIELPTTDPIFTKHDTSDIADRIGLPILTRRCPPDPKWANKSEGEMFKNSDPADNENAASLHQCLDPKAEFDFTTGSLGWGWRSAPWQNDMGRSHYFHYKWKHSLSGVKRKFDRSWLTLWGSMLRKSRSAKKTF
ncbi:hypothetical protein J4E91_006244 [Alternaria rosae]|nr:hypothetical protein J4E91_006244 [Alternaria rosae]